MPVSGLAGEGPEVAIISKDMKEEEGKKTPTDFVKVIKECSIFYTTFIFALVAIFR